VTPAAGRPVGRIVEKADFERMLAVPARQRSAHFALHHLPGGPEVKIKPGRTVGFEAIAHAVSTDLSTSDARSCSDPVDDQGDRRWLGTVVPKRHAKRAVTRNLVKRQMHQAFAVQAAGLPAGRWLLRLKAPFPTTEFVSARSTLLARVMRDELAALLARAASLP
jgi:ribonuclease P protein component